MGIGQYGQSLRELLPIDVTMEEDQPRDQPAQVADWATTGFTPAPTDDPFS